MSPSSELADEVSLDLCSGSSPAVWFLTNPLVVDSLTYFSDVCAKPQMHLMLELVMSPHKEHD